MQIEVICNLSCVATGSIELPEGLDWKKDVADWHVKWGVVHVRLKSGEWLELDAHLDTGDGIDWKRPLSTELFPYDESGEIDYSETLDERG